MQGTRIMHQGASFLPEDFVAETRVRRTGIVAAVLFPVMIVAVFAAFLVTNRQWAEVRAAQTLVDEETERAAREIAEMKSLERIRAQMNAKADLARELLEPVPRSVLIGVLVNTMPANVALTSLEMRTEAIRPPKPDPRQDAKNAAKARATAAADAKSRKGAAAAEPAREPMRRRTHVALHGLAPSLLEVGRWMTALEHIPVFAAVRLELMEERVVDGRSLSEFHIAIRIEPEADLRGWDGLAAFQSGRLPAAVAEGLGETPAELRAAHGAGEEGR